MTYLAVFIVALLVSYSLTPIAKTLSHRWDVVAKPGGRRLHSGNIPQLGGIPVFLGYLAGFALTFYLLPPSQIDDAIRLRGVLIGTIIVFVGGLLDDHFEFSAMPQFAIQAVGAAIAINHKVFIEIFTNPFSENVVDFDVLFGNAAIILAVIFTLFWVMGMMNAVNWLDGLDGLATGVGAIAVIGFALHARSLGQETVAAIPLALAGALLGFLPHNFSPAKIILGTAGVYVLGYNLATLAILSPAKIMTALLILGVPLLDAAWRIIDRVRQGKHPWRGDRGHLHFRLSDGGLPTHWIVLGYYAVAAIFGLVALYAQSRVKLIIFVVLETAVLTLVIWLNRRDHDD